MQDNTKTKQIFLFNEIIEAKYDPELFQQYLEKQKGLNLQDYTMTELTSIVNKFKGKQRTSIQIQQQISEIQQKWTQKLPKEQKGQNQEEKDNFQQQQSMVQDTIHSVKDSISSTFSTTTHFKYYEKKHISQLYKTVHLDHQQFSVKVRSFSKKQSTSLFKTTYIVYLIESSNGWSVKRRFSDFQWLLSILSESYPGFPIPPIPEKTTLRSFNDSHLEERMIMFEKLLNKLIKIPQLCSDKVIEHFLSINNQEQFNKIKTQYNQRVINQRKNHQITTLMGQHLLTHPIKLQRQQIMNYYKSTRILYQLNLQISNLETLLAQSTRKSFQIMNIFKKLANCQQKQKMEGYELHRVLADFIGELGNKINHELYHLKNQIHSNINYQFKCTEKLYKQLEEIMRQNDSVNKKSYEFKDMVLKNCDLLEPHNKQFREYLKNKQLHKVKLVMMSEEIKRHHKKDLLSESKEWAESLSAYMMIVKDAMLIGADHLTKAICISEGKQLREIQWIASISKKRQLDNSLIRQME